MRLFNRDIPLKRLPSLSVDLLRMLPASMQFKEPLDIWKAYFRRRPPKGNFVEFRNGDRAWLSSNPDDIISLVINFCRREYGPVPAGSAIVDIGANIGMYSLHACRSGASEVIAVEPVSDSAALLSRNLEPFREHTRIELIEKAVTSRQHKKAFLPKASSPYSRMDTESSSARPGYAEVPSITLDEVIASCQSERISILKLDCEGAEWDIFSDSDPNTLKKIDAIRMELHSKKGKDPSLILDQLDAAGFKITAHNHMIYWLDRVA